MTLIEKYDAVLNVLYSESGKSPSFDDITGKLGADGFNIHWGEIMDILLTLDKDGFIYQVTLVDDPEKKVRYLLGFNGKLLKETGGLEKKLEREKAKERLDSNLNNSNLKTGSWTRKNIVITSFIGSVTLIAVLTNLGITINRESKESRRQLQDSIQNEKTQESASELNKQLFQIHQTLSDTQKVKVKIEK